LIALSIYALKKSFSFYLLIYLLTDILTYLLTSLLT